MHSRPLVAFVLLAGMAYAGRADAQTFRLGMRRDFGAGTDPTALVLADFNRDGKADYVVTDRGADSITVRLGDGLGGFGPRVDYATGDLPVAVAAGDLNGDGIPELVVANAAAATVSLFRGALNGAFAAKTDFAVGILPSAVAIGDVTGDSHPDVVVTNFGSNSVTVLVGVGASSASGLSGASFPVFTGSGPRALAIVDLNRDGLNDLVTANQTADSLSVLHGTVDGGFGPRTDLPGLDMPFSVTSGDLNGDGWPDLATVAEGNGLVSVFLNTGFGTLGARVDYACELNPSAVAIGDMNGDALPDLVVVHDASAQVTFLPGTGAGAFGLRSSVQAGGSVVYSLAIADVDGDGRLDVVAPTQSPAGVSVLLGNGAGPFAPHVDLPAGTAPQGLAVGDVTGDGHPDIVVANSTSMNLSVYPNLGNGTFGARTDYPIGARPSIVRMANLNGDANPDLVVGTYSPFNADTTYLAVLLNGGGGVFGSANKLNLGMDYPVTGLDVGDVTGDGKVDVVLDRNSQTTVQVMPGNGLGSFAAGSPLTVNMNPTAIRIVDLNANGTPDLAVANGGSNNVSILLGNGSGVFAPKVDYAVQTYPFSLATGDLDGDGKLDLAAANLLNGSVSVLRGDGLGGFGPAANFFPLFGSPYSVAFGDVNADGIQDFVVGIGGTASAVAYGLGGMRFSPYDYVTAGSDQASVQLAQLDGNATLDLVTSNQTSNDVSVLLGLQRTKTVLEVTPNPSALGTSLTYTATVTEALPDTSAPSGTVRFFDGFELLGTATLSGGVATLVQAASLPWDRTLSAVYLGDGRFYGSFSAPVGHFSYQPNVAVDPLAPAFALALARNPQPSGTMVVRFSLPSPQAATLGLFDVRGRRIASREVAGSGGHAVDLGAGLALAPGVYLVRLVQAGRSSVARAVVVGAD